MGVDIVNNKTLPLNRRSMLAIGTTSIAAAMGGVGAVHAAETEESNIITPPMENRILLSCKLSMITKKVDGKEISIAERLKLAAEAGFAGVDFDEAGSFTPQEARNAVKESGVFVHNAINHAHWSKRLTSPKEEERKQGRENIAHCIRVSHAAGGSGVLIVLGRGGDGPDDVIKQRAYEEMLQLLPLSAALGQMILIENVWNQMMYDHNAPPNQGAEEFVQFIDRFHSPWVGMYYDIGNHWKYGRPEEWIRTFGHRCVKLDVKGFSRAKDKFVDITSPDDDLPWDQVRKALDDINFTGWATAEVGGGGVERLTQVRQQMEKAFGL